MNESSQDNKDQAKPSYGGYGKRPLWQWIVLYVVIGAVVYGLIYYFVFYNQKNGSTPYNTAAPSKSLY